MSVTLKKSAQFDDIVAAEGARSGFGQGALGLGGEDNGGRSSHSGSGSIRHLRGGNAASNGPRSGGGGLSYPPDPLQQQLYQDRHQQAGMPPPYGAASMPSSGGYTGMPYGIGPSSVGSPGMASASMGYPGTPVPQLSQYLPSGGSSGGGGQQQLGLDTLGSGLQQLPGGWSMPMQQQPQQQAPGSHMSGGQLPQGGLAGPPPAQQQQYALLLQQQLQLAQQQAHEAQQQQQHQQLAQQLASLQLAQQQAAQQYLGSPHTQPLQHQQQRQMESPHQQQLQSLHQHQQPSPHPQSPYPPERQQ